jgi:hypothetical protein
MRWAGHAEGIMIVNFFNFVELGLRWYQIMRIYNWFSLEHFSLLVRCVSGSASAPCIWKTEFMNE